MPSSLNQGLPCTTFRYPNFEPRSVECWSSVADAAPTFNRPRLSVRCFLVTMGHTSGRAQTCSIRLHAHPLPYVLAEHHLYQRAGKTTTRTQLIKHGWRPERFGAVDESGISDDHAGIYAGAFRSVHGYGNKTQVCRYRRLC